MENISPRDMWYGRKKSCNRTGSKPGIKRTKGLKRPFHAVFLMDPLFGGLAMLPHQFRLESILLDGAGNCIGTPRLDKYTTLAISKLFGSATAIRTDDRKPGRHRFEH